MTDTVGFLSPSTVSDLDRTLEDYEREFGHQILVYVTATTGGLAVEDYAVKAFEAWSVGRGGLDDGLVLFIFPEERTLRIEVGYGLEDDVPDILAARIIDDILVPAFRAGGQDEAVRDAVKVILAAASGDDSPLPEKKKKSVSDKGFWDDVALVIIILVVLYIFITNPRLAFYLLINILSSGGGSSGRGGWGGGGRSGGGFSGGGGRSGGGGASGSW